MKFKLTRAMRRRVACIGLSAAMCATFAAGQITAFADGGGAGVSASEIYSLDFENANGKIDLTQIKIDNLSKDVIKNTGGATADVYSLTRTVIVTLNGKPLSERGSAGSAARAEIADEQQAFLSELKKAGIDYTLKSNYYSIANAVAIDVKLSSLKDIKHIKGVSTVSVGSTYARPKAIKESDGAQKNDSNIYANGIYNSSEQVAAGYDGSGMTVAILDTGLDYTHEAFQKTPETVRFTADDVADMMAETQFKATQRSGATVNDVYVSAKVPFAYDYADSDANVYPSYSQHGTHVAGIVAGNADSYTDKDGNIAKDENGDGLEFHGVAPEAQLVICKVFTDNLDDRDIGGAEAVDILDALEDCYNLNVDVINMSLGTSAGFSSRALCPSDLKEDDEEGYLMKVIYQRIRDKGITLIVAASNEFSAGYGSAFGTNLTSNPDSGTVGAPSTFTGALSVASINGQYSPYLTAQADGGQTSSAIYFEESRNEDSDAYSFIDDLMGCDKEGCTDEYHIKNGLHDKSKYKQSETFKYVVIPGTGESADYMPSVVSKLKDKKDGEKVIAVIKRGHSPFKDKITTAIEYGADAVIVYNNVSGSIRMSLGDMRNRIPAISVNMDAGLILTGGGNITGGTITIDRSYLAGPFMNDYSSWGSTPDLKLKPDVTSHGGEITSTVAGGYDEMSGTSMACPNLAGFETIFKGYLKSKPELWKDDNATEEQNALALTELTHNIVMSTAVTVYDQYKLPYSPRKQGAGLASLKNVFGTQAYLYTDEADGMCEDGRPKAELGDDAKKKGVYTVKFYVKNFGDDSLMFKTNSIFMTETVGADKMSVAEKATLLTDIPAKWTVGGQSVAEGGTFSVAAGESVKIEVTLTLSDKEKSDLDKNFKNGMFVEGFLQLWGSDGQCDLTLPFMGFYGDWKAAPMMDLTCFEVAEDARDTSLNDEDRKQPRVWATQAYGYYVGDKYSIPLGSFLYIQDEKKEHTSEYVYVEEEHIAVSRDFHQYSGDDDDPNNYLTTTGIKALYAGLLRNAEVVTYTLTNVDTGEIIKDENGREERIVYRANKSYAGGGSSMPSQVLLELKTEELGLAANGKYRLDFKFFFEYEDYVNGTFTDEDGNVHGVYENNTFSMNFYIDYEAPVLVDSRLRFQTLTDSDTNKDYQKVFLDLDVFDNHYPQAVILCYSETDDGENTDMRTTKLATDYVVPFTNPSKNSVNTVSIDITEYYEEYGTRLFVEIDDYALNHNTYYLNLDFSRTTAVCPGDFKLTYEGRELAANGKTDDEITVEKNTAVKFGIENIGNADLSNFEWRIIGPNVAKVKNGELFAYGEGTVMLSVRGGRGVNGGATSKTVMVNIVDSDKTIPTENLKATFGAIPNADEALDKAQDVVKVNSGQKFTLKPIVEPWYFPAENLIWTWESDDTTRARVDGNGYVEVIYEGEYAEDVNITARAKLTEDGAELCKAEVTLTIQPAFTVSGTTLTKYRGLGGELKNDITIGGETFNNVRVLEFPKDKSILEIGSEAFKDCANVEVIVIPKGVTSIGEKAFKDCVNLKMICFMDLEPQPVADSSLTLIRRNAFAGCTSLTTVDFTNCKVFTLDRNVFAGCTSLKEVIDMPKVGTMYDSTFAGCTSLESADISKLYIAGGGVFAGCTSLTQITTGKDTVIGAYMFSGCTALEEVDINCPAIGVGAFTGCGNLQTVNYGYVGGASLTVGARAFENCYELTDFNANGKAVASLGDYAFSNCTKLNSPYASQGFMPELGNGVFRNVSSINGGVTDGTKLVHAPAVIDGAFVGTLGGITEIGANAFSDSRMAAGVAALDLSSVTKIGSGAFRGLAGLKTVTLSEDITEIPDYAFYGCSSLTQIEIPEGVTEIGSFAFYGCAALASVNLNALTDLKKIGAGAFGGVAVTSLSLPDGVKKIGDEAFARCSELTEVTIASVDEDGMGARVFALCPKLATAVFGENALSTGDYTFSTVGYGYKASVNGIGVTEFAASALTSVEFGGKIERIGEGVFAFTEEYDETGKSTVTYNGCDKLVQIDIKNVKAIGGYAFAGCSALESVTGIEEVTLIGGGAFEYCTALSSVDLSAAKVIYASAFMMDTSLAEVTLSDGLEGIGDMAFYGTSLTQTVEIPATCEYVGSAAFGRTKITEYTVAAGNGHYKSVDGVLYRYIDKAEPTYELTAYPTGRFADTVDGLRTFTVEEGTVSILAYAFNAVESNRVYKIILPYSLKVIGHGAFLDSSVNEYRFESIQAPTLLQYVMDRTIDYGNYSCNSFFYINFGSARYLTEHIVKYPGDTVSGVSYTLKMEYPSNGLGYENYIYNGFFGTNRVSIGEMPDDSARTLRKMIESFAYGVEDILGWKKGTDDETVKAFSETVKEAHALYNTLKSDVQLSHVTQANVDKLFAVESALREVKPAFGLKAKISTIVVDAGSTHRTEYTAGETFSLNGLKLLVTYDDYSTEVIGVNNFKPRLNRALKASDRIMTLDGMNEYEGKSVRIAITVSESAGGNQGGETPSTGESGGKEGLPTGALVAIIVVGAAVVSAAAAAAVVIVLKKRKAAASAGESAQAEEDNDQKENSGEEKTDD